MGYSAAASPTRMTLSLRGLMPQQDVAHGGGVPLPTARRMDATGVQGVGNGRIAGRAGRSDLLHDGHDIGREARSDPAVAHGGLGGRGRQIGAVAQQRALRLLPRQRRPGALADKRALFLGQGGVDVQHERIAVDAELSDDERHPVRHQAADEVHVAGQPIELRHRDGALRFAGVGQRRGELRAPLEGIAALAGLDLQVFADQFQAFGCGKAGDDVALRLDA